MIQKDFFGDWTKNEYIAPSSRKALGFYTATDADLLQLSVQKRQILTLLRGRWLSAADLIAATGATSAMRRVRELSRSFVILRRGSGRNWEYFYTGQRKN